MLGGRMSETKPLLVLVAGPYRSGTDGDPQRIRKNLQRLEAFALGVYKAGHVPLIGEWVALPLAEQAGSSEVGDAISEQFLYPVAGRLLTRCHRVQGGRSLHRLHQLRVVNFAGHEANPRTT